MFALVLFFFVFYFFVKPYILCVVGLITLWCSRHIPPGGGLGERGWGGKACAALLRRNSFDGGGPQDPAATSPTETRRHLAPAFAPSISWMQARPATWTASSTPLPSSWSCWRVVKLQVSPLPWPELGLQRHEGTKASWRAPPPLDPR